MKYIDGFVTPAVTARKQDYQNHALKMAQWLKSKGALRVTECWGDDVPEGKVTSFAMAVQRAEHETVVFSWIEWPDKQTRDVAWQTMMEDPAMKEIMGEDMPFDGKRLIYGGFAVMLDE